MTDYGHEMRFGVFVTPLADQADTIVELAKLAEDVGLDLVTFQDHPYQPSFLDTWTLLSFIAAETSNIRLAPNVLNVPLRPPVVLARSVASLDILSGGRAELGLGSGAFLDAIAKVGGPKLTAGQGVDALTEAIEIIRATWAAGGATLDHQGEHYRIVGANPGPAPAHDVEIWLGAYKRRMLALTGSSADGWLPSMGYADVEALPAMHAAIDEAAIAAGRSPSDVRRLYNINGRFESGPGLLRGSPAEWAKQLSELTLSLGMSTYILAADSSDDIRRFATEVAPAVRELVAAGRGADPQPDPSARPATVPSTEAAAAPLAVTPTPDSGQRLSEELPWDEASRPTGPTPDGERVFTAEQQAAGQHLIDIHDVLRGELDRLRSLIEQVALGTMDIGTARAYITRMTIRQNNWTLGAFCASYCLTVAGHHSLEDSSVFPRLKRRDPGLAPVVDRLQEEHHTITDVLEGVDQALVALVSDPDGLTRVRKAIDLLTDTLLSHLSYEERELVEPLARWGF